MTMRAFSYYISVGKKLMSLFIVVLFGFFFYQLAVVVELSKEIRSKVVMRFRSGTTVNIERNTEILEALFD